MNCAKARANLSAYVEQELSEKDRRQVSSHLGRCDRCSRDLFAMQKAINLLRWVPRPEARPDFDDRLYERLRAEERSHPAPWARLQAWVDALGERFDLSGWRLLVSERLVASPASALLIAVLLGTGGGALLMRTTAGSRGDEGLAASTPEIMSARSAAQSVAMGASAATTAPTIPAASPAPESAPLTVAEAPSANVPVPAVPSTEPKATASSPRHKTTIQAPLLTASTAPQGSLPVKARRAPQSRYEIAPWASNEQPIEGPPSVSQVEYVLDRVNVNQERVLELPASAVVSGSTVTF
jgi:anti-sigma factor RsiW